MMYRVVILNKSMNPVYSTKFDVSRQDDFMAMSKRWLETFWRYRSQDSDCSIRIVPAESDAVSQDLFSEGHDIIF